jgi:hypothetical protein
MNKTAAVLIDSKREGESCWSAIRSSREILVAGLSSGDLVEIHFCNGEVVSIDPRGGPSLRLDVPEGAERVKAVHKEANGDSGVYVDLVL